MFERLGDMFGVSIIGVGGDEVAFLNGLVVGLLIICVVALPSRLGDNVGVSIIVVGGDEVGFLNGVVVGLIIALPSTPRQRLVSPAKFLSQHLANVSCKKNPGLAFI